MAKLAGRSGTAAGGAGGGRVSISIPLHGCRGGQKCRRRPRRAPGNLYWLHQKGRVAMFSGSLLAIVLLVAGVVILFKTVRVVPQGYEWTVDRKSTRLNSSH